MTSGDALASPVRPTQHHEFTPRAAAASRRSATLAIVATSPAEGDACRMCFGLADKADAKHGYLRL